MNQPLIKEDAERLQGMLAGIAPITSVSFSDLGSKEDASLYLLIILDPKESWANTIMENSRYIRVSVDRKNWLNRKKEVVHGFRVEHFSGSFTFRNKSSFRTVKVETLEQVVEKLKQYVDKFPTFEAIKDEVAALGGMNAWMTKDRQSIGEFLAWEER